MNPKKPPPVNTQIYTLLFVGVNKSVKKFWWTWWHNRTIASIQCSFFGNALTFFLRLHETYKSNLSAFVFIFEKKLSSQNSAYNAQVANQALTKKRIENVRVFVLKFQQLLEKGWCIESAATFHLKCDDEFLQGFLKELEDSAHKRKSNMHPLLWNLLSPSYNGWTCCCWRLYELCFSYSWFTTEKWKSNIKAGVSKFKF